MIDIDGCRYVTVSDCYGDSEDDALTLKSTGDAPTEHVTITNCILASHCNGLKMGTESAGGFKDVTITNCVIKRSGAPEVIAGRAEGLAGIALEIVDGGLMDRIAISNVTVEGYTAPIFLRLGHRGRPAKEDAPKPETGAMRNITIDKRHRHPAPRPWAARWRASQAIPSSIYPSPTCASPSKAAARSKPTTAKSPSRPATTPNAPCSANYPPTGSTSATPKTSSSTTSHSPTPHKTRARPSSVTM